MIKKCVRSKVNYKYYLTRFGAKAYSTSSESTNPQSPLYLLQKPPAIMQFYSLLVATMALAISTVYALPATDDATCLRLCREEKFDCPAGWKSELIKSDTQVRLISIETIFSIPDSWADFSLI